MSRSTQAKRGTASKQQPPSLFKYSKLTDAEVTALARSMRTEYGWNDDPKPFQMVGVRAQLEGVDTIIQASTGAGKTAVVAGPHRFPAAEGRITLFSVPLIQLAEEMVETFATDFHLKAIAIHSKNGALSPVAIRDILAGKYQVIIASPEMLQSRSFVNRLLRNPCFSRRVLSLVVDEAHCISHWGSDFRKKYSSLGVVRTFLPRGAPVVAVTATLTARVRRDIHSKLFFPKSGSQFCNEGNDRPNVSIIVRACEHPMGSYHDLDWMIPARIRDASDIDKAYVYVDNINTGTEIIDHLAALLEERCMAVPQSSHAARPVDRGIIRPFNSQMSDEYKRLAMEKFRNGDIRILVCTDAVGMGCNIRDVDIVVQWKLPATLSNFVQRGGRAARDPRRAGLIVLLVEPSAYSVNLVNPGQAASSNKKKRRQKRSQATSTAETAKASKKPRKSKAETEAIKMYAHEHGVHRGLSDGYDDIPTGAQPLLDTNREDEGLLAFVQSTSCRRKVWALAYENDPLKLPPRPHGVLCCDICSPELLERTRPEKLLSSEVKEPPPKKGLADKSVIAKLKTWRSTIADRDHAKSSVTPSAILENSLLQDLASFGPISSKQLQTWLETHNWTWRNVYGTELDKFLEGTARSFVPLPKKLKKTSGGNRGVTHEDFEEGTGGTVVIDDNWHVTVANLASGEATNAQIVTGFVQCSFPDNDLLVPKMVEVHENVQDLRSLPAPAPRKSNMTPQQQNPPIVLQAPVIRSQRPLPRPKPRRAVPGSTAPYDTWQSLIRMSAFWPGPSYLGGGLLQHIPDSVLPKADDICAPVGTPVTATESPSTSFRGLDTNTANDHMDIG